MILEIRCENKQEMVRLIEKVRTGKALEMEGTTLAKSRCEVRTKSDLRDHITPLFYSWERKIGPSMVSGIRIQW